jgi:hypothetical protein
LTSEKQSELLTKSWTVGFKWNFVFQNVKLIVSFPYTGLLREEALVPLISAPF